jgi:hypothetical protein
MPNCFQFVSKETQEAERLSVIDDKLCAFLGVEPDPKWYHLGWKDSVGFCAALGDSFEKMREIYFDAPDLIKAIDWFDEHYTIRCWYEHS